jgi:hypothetical protein
MNEFGEPNMGNPSVRFDEGRERVGHWPLAFQSNRSCLLYNLRDETFTTACFPFDLVAMGNIARTTRLHDRSMRPSSCHIAAM